MFFCQNMCIEGFGVTSFVYNEFVYIMPKILSNSTCALRGMVW